MSQNVCDPRIWMSGEILNYKTLGIGTAPFQRAFNAKGI